MKTTIRQRVFETNSSSMHAICIVNEEELKMFKKGELNLNVSGINGQMTRAKRLVNNHDHIWDWNDFINSNIDGYDMINDEEEFGDKFPPGSIEDLGEGTYKLHYQS